MTMRVLAVDKKTGKPTAYELVNAPTKLVATFLQSCYNLDMIKKGLRTNDNQK